MTIPDATVETKRPAALAREAAPGAVAKARRAAPVPLDELADTGQPVDFPPPLIEPIGFDEEPRPPSGPTPRELPSRLRSLFAPLGVIRERMTSPAASVTKPAAERVEVAVEPVTVEPAPRRSRMEVPARLAALTQQWRSPAAATKLGDRGQLIYWARWAAAAAVLAAFAYFAGFESHRPAPGSVAPLAGAPSDPAQRLAYFQRGADAGDAEAELQLAILYAKGEGVTQDYPTAARWFRAAAEQGLPRAQYDLGVLYERGRGVTTDPAQAAIWYRKAAEGKYPLAQYNLAVAYTKGEGTRKDPAEAALWYRRAAAQGVVQAMINLGMLYERGEGVPVSQVDAYSWYLAAGQRGNQAAAKRAADLFGVLSQNDQIRAQVLASDVAGSIHDPAQETPGGG